jgi:predicted kinase
MLIILGGLPGVGKTTVARELARELGAVHVRIDSIEQTIRDAGVVVEDLGYRVGYAVAADNLRLGRTVVADSVNPWPLTRAAWREVASHAGVPALEVEITCSSTEEHRRRVETRIADVDGLRLPSWQQVLDRDYRPWENADIVIDTAEEDVQRIVAVIKVAVSRS